MLPSEFPEVQDYPHLKLLLDKQVNMQIADLRTLLKLPLPELGLNDGANLAAASLLFNFIAGCSVCFYDASRQGRHSRRGRGKRFQDLLRDFFPWQGEQFSKTQGIKALYESARNPLAHSLGLDSPPTSGTGNQILLRKWALSGAEIQELENSLTKPSWAGSTILTESLASGATQLTISIPALYWGAHRMLHSLFADLSHAAKAEALATRFAPLWYIYLSVFDEGHGEDTVSVARTCSTCGAELVPANEGSTFKCPDCTD